jgi:hypothetical protein
MDRRGRVVAKVSGRLGPLLLGIPLFCCSAQAQDLMRDAKAVRAKEKAAIFRIDHIVRRYIHVGDSQENVERYLSGLKFKVYPTREQRGDRPPSMLGVATLRRPLMTFDDEVRVIVDIEEGRVKDATGFVVAQAL